MKLALASVVGRSVERGARGDAAMLTSGPLRLRANRSSSRSMQGACRLKVATGRH